MLVIDLITHLMKYVLSVYGCSVLYGFSIQMNSLKTFYHVLACSSIPSTLYNVLAALAELIISYCNLNLKRFRTLWQKGIYKIMFLYVLERCGRLIFVV